MKRRTGFMWAQVASMYLMQIPFSGYAIALLAGAEVPASAFWAVTALSVIFCAAACVFATMNTVAAFRGLYAEQVCPYSLTMAVKLALVPFFIINFVIWALFVIGSLNPFLIWALPVIICVSVFFTYVLMLGTSVHNIAFLLKKFKDEWNLSCAVYMVLHFIFCLDVLAAVILGIVGDRKTELFVTSET